MFGGLKKTSYLCTRLQEMRAFSSVGLEHLPYKQRVGGSNPSTPTKSSEAIRDSFFVKYQKKYVLTRNFFILISYFSFILCTFAISLDKVITQDCIIRY